MSDLQTHTNGLAPDHGTIINQANSQHSTGPRTAAGKQRSSLNALRHGLTGHVIVLPSEDHTAYESHTRRFFNDLQPKGALETSSSSPYPTLRGGSIASPRSKPISFPRHPRTVGPIDTAHPEVHTALAMAASIREQIRALANLSMHEHRLSRQFERALNQLREIQAERRELEEKDNSRKPPELLQMRSGRRPPLRPNRRWLRFFK